MSRTDSPVGKGALGTVEGRKVLLGNAAFMRSRVDTSALEAAAERERGEAATVINMAADALPASWRSPTR
jgi:Cu+-exporting ATPase